MANEFAYCIEAPCSYQEPRISLVRVSVENEVWYECPTCLNKYNLEQVKKINEEGYLKYFMGGFG